MSGEAIAKRLEISRTAVWKGIKTLESKGLTIQSVKTRGYKLLKGDLLLPEFLSQELGITVTFNPDSQSTQTDAKNGMEKGLESPHLYLANQQTAAKGRFNRNFFTSPQGGIYMSLHFKPQVTVTELPPYTVMVASSIVKAISRLTGIETEIKWVNDIYLDNRKVAGILTEAVASVESGLVTDVIIGVGINFQIEQFPETLQSKATSLFSEKASITRNQLIAEIWKLVLTIPEKDLVKVYKEKSLVLDKQVTFVENGIEMTGTATDITDQGHLIVRLENGREKILRSGEVSLSSW